MAVPVADLSLADAAAYGAVDVETAPRSRWRRDLELWLPAGFLIFLVGTCFLWPLIHTIPGPEAGSITNANLPPLSPGALFGTDNLGNDIFSRILYGGRVLSIEVGLGANLIGLVIGGFIGSFAALKRGLTEAFLMRCLDVFLAFPSIVLAIIVATFLGPSVLHVTLAISFFSIPAFARLARAHTLRSRDQIYVLSAKIAGSKDRSILFRHIIPNVLPGLLTFSLLGVALAIIVEAPLSFLGYGVPPPGPSWGNMLADGQTYLSTNFYLTLIPACFLFTTVLSLNLLGDAVRAMGDELIAAPANRGIELKDAPGGTPCRPDPR